jgi:hypothetical protein
MTREARELNKTEAFARILLSCRLRQLARRFGDRQPLAARMQGESSGV